jgi:hypothetical protein
VTAALRRALEWLARSRGGGYLRITLGAVALIPAIWHFHALATIFWRQVGYPMDLEWMEGGQLYHAYRFIHGLPVYSPPSQGYLPYPYPPVHFMLSGLVGAVAGFGYAPARLLSVVSILTASGLLCWQIVRDAPSRWLGGVLAALAAATLSVSMPVVDGWYALIRVDSLMLALTVGAATVAMHENPGRGRIAALCTLLVLMVFAKQTAVFFGAWIVCFLFARNRRAGIFVGLGTLLGCVVLLGIMQLWSRGWFLSYLMATGQHQISEERIHAGLWNVLKCAPHVAVIPVVAAFLLGRRTLSARAGLWVGLLVAAIPMSVLGFAKASGWKNNLIPVLFLAGPTLALVAVDAIKSASAQLASLLLRAGSVAYLSLLLLSSKYITRAYYPSADQTRRAEALGRWVASLPGEVLTLSHPMLAINAGKRTEQIHAMAIFDAIDGGIDGCGFADFLRRTRPDYIVIDQNLVELTFRGAMDRYYERVGEVPVRIEMIIATQVYPVEYFRRKPDPPARRVQFDFESGGYAGWVLTGNAFQGGPSSALRGSFGAILGFDGARYASSYRPDGGEAAMGVAKSPPFVIDRRFLSLLVGGSHGAIRVELEVDGQVVAQTGASHYQVLQQVEWDVSAWRGKRARLSLIDQDRRGHLFVDQVELHD